MSAKGRCALLSELVDLWCGLSTRARLAVLVPQVMEQERYGANSSLTERIRLANSAHMRF